MAKRSASTIMEELNPVKSAKRYETTWLQFAEFCGSNERPLEDHFIRYFDYLRREKSFQCSTLWSIYSMLNHKYQSLYGYKLQMFPRVTMQLKSYEAGYQRKSAKSFGKEEIFRFLEKAPDYGEHIHVKVAVILGFYGGLRCADLVSLCCEDLEYNDTCGYWVAYKVSKQKGEIIQNKFNVPPTHCSIVQTYCQKLTSCGLFTGRLFKCYRVNKTSGCGYYTAQPMGVHVLSKIPLKVAEFLQLPEKNRYTGHAMRRSAASTLAEAGASSSDLKTHFNWRSEQTALKYIDNTNNQKLKVSKLMEGSLDKSENSESTKETKVLNISNCSNIIINL